MAVVKSAVEALDVSDEMSKTQKELLSTLNSLAETKAQLFQKQLDEEILGAASGGNKTVPVSSIVGWTSIVRVLAHNKPNDIGGTVRTSLAKFLSGTASGVLDGVANVMTEALSGFFGESVASSSMLEQYYVLTEGVSVLRVDIKAWYQQVEATGLRESVESICVVAAKKSTVDLSRIDLATLLFIYKNLLEQGKAGADVIEDAITQAQQIWQKLRGSQSPDATLRLGRMPGETVIL